MPLKMKLYLSAHEPEIYIKRLEFATIKEYSRPFKKKTGKKIHKA